MTKHVFVSKDKREEVYSREAAEILAEISSLQESSSILRPASKANSFLLRRLATVQTLRTAIRLQRQAVQNQQAEIRTNTNDSLPTSHSQKPLSARQRLRKTPSSIVPLSAAKMPKKIRNKRKPAAQPASEDRLAGECDDELDVGESGVQGKTPRGNRHQTSWNTSKFTASVTHSDDSDENTGAAHFQARKTAGGHDEVTYEPAVSRISVRSKSGSLTLATPKHKRSRLSMIRCDCMFSTSWNRCAFGCCMSQAVGISATCDLQCALSMCFSFTRPKIGRKGSGQTRRGGNKADVRVRRHRVRHHSTKEAAHLSDPSVASL